MEITLTLADLSQHETRLVRWQADRDQAVLTQLMNELTVATGEPVQSIVGRMKRLPAFNEPRPTILS